MLYRLARTGFFQLDAEKAHDLAIKTSNALTALLSIFSIVNNYQIVQ